MLGEAIVSTYMVIMALPFIVAFLTVLTFVLPSQKGFRRKMAWTLLLLACASRGVVYRELGGNAQSPELPEWLLWIWDWACSGLFLLFLFSLVWRVRAWRTVVLPILAWGLAAFGFVNGIMPPDVREIELCWPGLPEDLDGYRIVQVSDLHCSSSMRGWRTRAVVERVNAAKPNVICLTGDYVDGEVSRLAGDMEPLKELHAPDGVWCVRGNHEYYRDRDAWRKWFSDNGFRFLVNECVFPRRSLALGGVNDSVAARYGGIMPDVRKTFAAATNGEFCVLMDHRSKYALESFEMHGVRLQLSGHTHGGIVPGLDKLVGCFNGGYVRGAYKMPGGWLFVSPGVGQWSGFPLRFFNPPEIDVIVLRRTQ